MDLFNTALIYRDFLSKRFPLYRHYYILKRRCCDGVNMLKIRYGLAIAGALVAIILVLSPVLGDNEPNDSLNDPETITEGTYTGDVSINILMDNDLDYYIISVPADKDIVVTAKKIDSGEGTITIQGYDHNKQSMGIFDIWIYLTTPGETDSASYWNTDDTAQNVYLEIEGDGQYEFTIEFTNDSSDAVTGLAAA